MAADGDSEVVGVGGEDVGGDEGGFLDLAQTTRCFIYDSVKSMLQFDGGGSVLRCVLHDVPNNDRPETGCRSLLSAAPGSKIFG